MLTYTERLKAEVRAEHRKETIYKALKKAKVEGYPFSLVFKLLDVPEAEQKEFSEKLEGNDKKSED